ncbi:MAG: sugar phosphate isomerase/epimerase [Alcaligenaceae bacterium]|nr:sugar phosphate isomerase/epimerase [Alcaligenaceae bacterium SAGV5]MPS53162.1 sugar phosphate isomerase/epimerase [Alcaligenaceae bacterium SAGV3]MPT55400.1 sugar phosphate isomerase/epimerase [Alcaligenaceae bacterium]
MQAPFHLNHYICPPEVGLIEFLDLAVSRGFAGVALTERALAQVAPTRLAHELQTRGLDISSVNSAGYFLHADARAANEQARKNQALLEACAELGGAALNVIVGGLGHAAGSMTLETARERAGAALQGFAAQAAQAGVPLLFEPIHPMGMWFKGCVHTLAQSLRMIERLPGRNAITLDCFHSWWDEDLHDFLANEASPLAVVQICDVALFGEESIPRRAPPGEGVIDLGQILRACLDRPAPPKLELELFAAQLPGRDLAEVVDSSMRVIRNLALRDAP